jgi:hypothetical protein
MFQWRRRNKEEEGKIERQRRADAQRLDTRRYTVHPRRRVENNHTEVSCRLTNKW